MSGSTPFHRLAVAVLAAALLAANAAAEPITVDAVAVDLDPADPGRQRVGRLIYRGGLKLESGHRRFGGFSALHVDAEGRGLVAVSDLGWVLAARLVYDRHGNLADLAEAALRTLPGLDGRALSKRWRDVESLAPDGAGGFVVAFERAHRVWHYPAGPTPFATPPTAWPMPPGLESAPANGGIEALAAADDSGTLLALTEELEDGGDAVGWVGGRSGWARLGYRKFGIFQPTAATRLPSGRILVLERGFVLADLEISARLVRLEPADLRAGARLAGAEVAVIRQPLTVDNMEGLAARAGRNGKTLIYLISDDNFSPLQRTLLMMFELDE